MSKTLYRSQVSDPSQRYNDNVKKLNVLIVDDDINSRESLGDMIKIHGHNVTTLDEGMKCVNRCSENNFDIIFMDYHIDDIDGEIGELSGTDVIRMVRDCFNINSVIYAYTGDNTTKAIEEFKNNSVKGAFIKPVEPSLIAEFLKISEKHLDDSPQLRKLAMKKKNFMYFSKQKK
jgi:CheY-like chemotaxis protein